MQVPSTAHTPTMDFCTPPPGSIVPEFPRPELDFVIFPNPWEIDCTWGGHAPFGPIKTSMSCGRLRCSWPPGALGITSAGSSACREESQVEEETRNDPRRICGTCQLGSHFLFSA